MTSELRRITIDSLIAVTGMGKRTTMRLVREGKLPGRFEGIHYLCMPGEFDAWYRGEWEPRTTDPISHSEFESSPVKFVQRRKSA